MTNQSSAAYAMIQKQLKELDEIFQETMETLNTVAGAERMAKWKARTSCAHHRISGPERRAEVCRPAAGALFYQRLGGRVYRSHRLFQSPA